MVVYFQDSQNKGWFFRIDSLTGPQAKTLLSWLYDLKKECARSFGPEFAIGGGRGKKSTASQRANRRFYVSMEKDILESLFQKYGVAEGAIENERLYAL